MRIKKMVVGLALSLVLAMGMVASGGMIGTGIPYDVPLPEIDETQPIYTSAIDVANAFMQGKPIYGVRVDITSECKFVFQGSGVNNASIGISGNNPDLVDNFTDWRRSWYVRCFIPATIIPISRSPHRRTSEHEHLKGKQIRMQGRIVGISISRGSHRISLGDATVTEVEPTPAK